MRRYSPWIVEAWATWEVLRKLGFKADDIFWVFQHTANAIPQPGIALNIVLRTQGKQMVITCSHALSEGEARRVEAASRRFQEELSSGAFDEDDMTARLHKSFVWTNKVAFVNAVKGKGFVFPYMLAGMN